MISHATGSGPSSSATSDATTTSEAAVSVAIDSISSSDNSNADIMPASSLSVETSDTFSVDQQCQFEQEQQHLGGGNATTATTATSDLPYYPGIMKFKDNNQHGNGRNTTALLVTQEVEPNAPPFPRLELISRRAWMARVTGSALVGGVALGGGTMMFTNYQNQTATTAAANKKARKLAPVNATRVALETGINITVIEGTGRTAVTLDRTTFQKNRQFIGFPGWLPSYLTPPPRVIKEIPNSELLTAAIVAGSTVEMVRTALLYPLQTLKTRVQTDINRRQRRYKQLHLRRRLRVVQLNAVRHVREGNLYAGLLPSLLVSVPATGVYYATRDITKRMLVTMAPLSDTSSAAGAFFMNINSDLGMVLTAALVADVVSLAFRTPADTLALRLQVASGQQGARDHDDDETAEEIAEALAEARIEAQVGKYWFAESLQRLPAVIATDLPYLLSRIAVNGLLLQGQTSIDIGSYEISTLSSALLCAFLTTPFDVARTRILVDSDDDVTTGVDGGSQQGLLQTFQSIVKEGNGGVGNLFAGWLERTAYLGISSLWLPFALLLYVAIRDAILLEWFD